MLIRRNRYETPARRSNGAGCALPLSSAPGNGPLITFVVGPASLNNITRSVSASYRVPGSTTTIDPYSPDAICPNSSKCEWYMNVPARGGVNRTVSESLGGIAGSSDVSDPLHPGTPSGKLSSSMPCQWTAAGTGDWFTTVMATGSFFSNTSVGPGSDSVAVS